jgi:general secretion pathway protein N
VTKWHPATKLLLIAGALAVPYLLWTQPEDEPVAAVPAGLAAADPAPEQAARTDQAAVPEKPFILPPLERFTAVVERPLFSPTRRMPPIAEPPDEAPASAAPEEAPVAGPSGPEEPDVRFFGTVRQGGKAAALVTFPSTSEVARLAPGDRVGAWEVLEVDGNRLVLGQGDEQRSFEIFGASLRGAAAPAEDSAEAPAPEPEDAATAEGGEAEEPSATEQGGMPDDGEAAEGTGPDGEPAQPWPAWRRGQSR